MARIFITGSADGLGLMAGRKLTGEGHAVVLHARDPARAAAAQAAVPRAEAVVTGDVSTLATMRDVAAQATQDDPGRETPAVPHEDVDDEPDLIGRYGSLLRHAAREDYRPFGREAIGRGRSR